MAESRDQLTWWEAASSPINGEMLAQSMALSEALRHNGLARRTYSLQRPDRIHRAYPLDESASVRRHRRWTEREAMCGWKNRKTN